MKSGEALRLIKDVLPPHIDLSAASSTSSSSTKPTTSPRRWRRTTRSKASARASSAGSRHTSSTALPHRDAAQRLQESFTSLLELLDDQRFARNIMPEEKQLQRVMVRRLKTDLVDADGKPIYPKREIKPLEVEYTAEEREAHKLLERIRRRSRKTVAGTKREFGSHFVLNLLKKRLFSSPRAFAITLEKHREPRGPRRRKRHARLDERILRKAIAKLEEDYSSDEQIEQADRRSGRRGQRQLPSSCTSEQRGLLDRLSAWAAAAKGRPDSKAKAILAWLDEHLRPGRQVERRARHPLHRIPRHARLAARDPHEPRLRR